MTHETSRFKRLKFPIVLVCEAIVNASNLGGLFRTADAFGVEKLYLSQNSAKIGGRMTRSSRATEKTIEHEVVEHLPSIVEKLKAEGYLIIGLEITSESHSLSDYRLPSNTKIAVVIGNEKHGLSHPLLELSDTVLHIPMFGQNSSMNVVQATSIALYEMTKQIDNSAL